MRLKHLIIAMLTIALSSVFADTISAQQNFHFRKGWEYADIDWERSAFSEWERGMSAGEMSSTVMVAACYMREYGVGRNVSKGVSILENLAAKNAEVALFTANFWFPILDNDPFFNYKPHAGGQYNFWAMASWWKEVDLKSTTFGLDPNYNKVMKYAKMYLSKVSAPGYGRSLANDMIGYCYENGLGGVSKNVYKAMEHYGESDKFYTLALQEINKVTTREDAEKIVSTIKPYINDKNVLSAIQNKNDDNLTDIRKSFVETYIEKYYVEEYKQLDEWWRTNDPIEYPERFHSEYENAGILKKPIDKRFNALLQDIQENVRLWQQSNDRDDPLEINDFDIQLTLNGYSPFDLAEKCSKLWTAYPDSWDNSKKLELANSWCRLMIEDIENSSLSDEESITQLLQLKESSIPKFYANAQYRGDLGLIDSYISNHESNIVNSLYKVFEKYTKQEGHRFNYGWRTVLNNWEWKDDEIPYECRSYNMNYGSSIRDSGRQKLLEKVDNEMMPAINEILRIGESQFKKYSHRCTETIFRIKQANFHELSLGNFSVDKVANTLMSLYHFTQIIKKENDGSIKKSDYEEYLKKYPNAYYKQYCKDGIAMLTADSYTLATPKEEIKTLLKSGISKGAAKYVKEHTKKSYLKTKSL